MNKEKISRLGLPILLIACFTLLSGYIATGALAKYASSANNSSSATVAAWSTGVNSAINGVNMVSGSGAQNCTITVTSESEVSSAYSLVLSNIPNGVTVALDGGTAQTPSSGNLTFSNVNSFSASSGTTSRNHTLTFNTALSTAATSLSNVAINVIFTQID